MLNIMTCNHVFQLGYHIPILLEDFYTRVALWLPRFMLKCISKPFNEIEFPLGDNEILYFHVKACIVLHTMHPPQRLAEGILVPCHQLRWPKKRHMKDIVNLKCAWQFHMVCYDPYPLGCPKLANPSWYSF